MGSADSERGWMIVSKTWLSKSWENKDGGTFSFRTSKNSLGKMSFSEQGLGMHTNKNEAGAAVSKGGKRAKCV